LRATVRELFEHIAYKQAVREWRDSQRKDPFGDDDITPIYRSDEEAQKLVDTPVWTGDPELDAIEARETDPLKMGNLVEEYNEWIQQKKASAARRARKAPVSAPTGSRKSKRKHRG